MDDGRRRRMNMDIVERDRGTNRVVKVLDSFNISTSSFLVTLFYDSFYHTKYWVSYRYQSANFFTLFFACRYFEKLKEKYKEEEE